MQVIRTLRQRLKCNPVTAAWLDKTQQHFNFLTAIFWLVLDHHPDLAAMSTREAADAVERLTHRKGDNPDPPMYSALAQATPYHFRRAALMAAIGAYKSFATNRANWLERKRKAEEKAAARGKKSQFRERPPMPPRSWNRSPVFYKRMHRNYDGRSIELKLYDGEAWRWVKFELSEDSGREGWERGSPRAVKDRSGNWCLHTPFVMEIGKPEGVEKQMEGDATRICSVDLNINEHLAVATVLNVKGEVVATKFIGGGRELNARRMKQLGRTYRRMRATGVIGKGEHHCRKRWDKVKAMNENAAHLISRRIVDFAHEHGATIIVFENLKSFKPQRNG